MKLAIILNYKKESTTAIAAELCSFLEARGCSLLKPADRPGFHPQECAAVDFSSCEAAILLGGDGTLLSACRYIKNRSLPLLAVNMGRLGFLTEIEGSELFNSMEKLLHGEYETESRSMLHAELFRDGECYYSSEALNDFVLDGGSSYRSTTITAEIDGEFVTTSRATGVIFSSPTGSTAYALSAGGPLVMPQVKANVLCYIAPHSLHNRPIVLPEQSIVKLLFSNSEPCRLIADGQATVECQTGDELLLTTAPQRLKLLRLHKPNFFAAVNGKLINNK